MAVKTSQRVPLESAQGARSADEAVVVRGEGLTIDDIVHVARYRAPVRIADDQQILERVEASRNYVVTAVDAGQAIYGVTTGFGGMAHKVITVENAMALQNNLIWFMKTGTGRRLPKEDVRAAMLLRINSHLRGASGLRLELIRRMETFLNAGVTPHVCEFGSIGASGDLAPLSSITGALIGLDASFTVDFNGEEMDSLTALKRLGLSPMRLGPKEGLAMLNGTSVMTGVAANCVYDARILLALTMGAHALMIQALRGTNQSFHPFIHDQKAHPGQKWAAASMLELLAGSKLVREELGGQHDFREGELIQDRYSLRCLPQFVGPAVDALAQIAQQVEVEANSAN
ncbi:MAG: aromatic amino acid lyase, partial [Chloroflexi bacterium]